MEKKASANRYTAFQTNCQYYHSPHGVSND